MSCSEGAEIKWSDFYDVGVKIDDLADTLHTPGYERLDSKDHTPWPLASTINDTFYMRFEVAGGTDDGECAGCIITKRCMTEGAGAPYTFPDPVLQNLADDDNLFFVADSTECWCKYIFKVVKSEVSGEYTLKAIDDTPECCTTLDVPEVGDPLCYNQHWIPAAYVKDWKYRNYSGPSRTFNVDACRKPSAEQVQLYFTDGSGPGIIALVAGERRVTGYFTWRIKAEWVDMLRSSLDFIGACAHSGGVHDSKLLQHGHDLGSGDYEHLGCAGGWCDLWWNGFAQWGNDGEAPGCLASDTTECCIPWEESCCGGETCDSKNKVYCETLTQLNSILDNIDGVFYPWDEGGVNCPECCNPACELSGVSAIEVHGGDSRDFEISNAARLESCMSRYGITLHARITLTICTSDTVTMSASSEGASTSCTDPSTHCIPNCVPSDPGCLCSSSCVPLWAPDDPLCAEASCMITSETCGDCQSVSFDLDLSTPTFTVDVTECADGSGVGQLTIGCEIIVSDPPP